MIRRRSSHRAAALHHRHDEQGERGEVCEVVPAEDVLAGGHDGLAASQRVSRPRDPRKACKRIHRRDLEDRAGEDPEPGNAVKSWLAAGSTSRGESTRAAPCASRLAVRVLRFFSWPARSVSGTRSCPHAREASGLGVSVIGDGAAEDGAHPSVDVAPSRAHQHLAQSGDIHRGGHAYRRACHLAGGDTRPLVLARSNA